MKSICERLLVQLWTTAFECLLCWNRNRQFKISGNHVILILTQKKEILTKLNWHTWLPSLKKMFYVHPHSGQHLSAQIRQFKTEKIVTLVSSSRCLCITVKKITVKNLYILKNCSLEICNFIINGVRCG